MLVQAARPSSGALRTLVDFYDPRTNAPDSRGRTLAEMLAWPDSRLESCHDYIQILFPLPEGSVFNCTAPVVDEPTILWLRTTSSGEKVLGNVRRAFERIVGFYGFSMGWGLSDNLHSGLQSDHLQSDHLHSDTAHSDTAHSDAALSNAPHSRSVPKVLVVVTDKAKAARQNLANWVCPMDHNHLRITRILRSLRVLGLEDEAGAFFAALSRTREKYGRISAQSFRFWTRAMELPLHMAPDGGDVDWLRKYH